MKFLIVLILLSNTLFINAQENDKYRSIADSIWKYYVIDSTKALSFSKKLLKLSKEEENYKQEFRAYYFFFVVYVNNGDLKNSKPYSDKMLDFSIDKGLIVEQLKSIHLKNMSIIKDSGYDDNQILTNYQKAIDIAKKNNLIVWENKFYSDVAYFHKYVEDYKKAINYFKKINSTLLKIKNSESYKRYKAWGISLEKNYLDLTDVYIQLNQIEKAKFYNNKAKNVLDTITGGYSDFHRYLQKINVFEISLLEHNTKDLEKLYDEVIALIPNYFSEERKNEIKNNFQILIAYELGDYKKVIDTYKQFDIKRIKKDEDRGLFLDTIYKKLYKSYFKLNDLENADIYFEKFISNIQKKKRIQSSLTKKLVQTEKDFYFKEVEKLKRNRKSWIYSLVLFSAVLIIILFILLKNQKNKIHKAKELRTTLSEKGKKEASTSKKTEINLKNDEVDRIVKSLNELMKDEFYLKTDCTLALISKKLKTNTSYLSKIINIKYQKTFTQFINDLRINYTVNRLKNDKQFRRYSIQSIANEVGFKSRESFNNVFKKRVGILPSKFIKELKKA